LEVINMVQVLRVLGVVILFGGVLFGLVVGVAPMITGYGPLDSGGQPVIPVDLIYQGAALLGFAIVLASITIGLDFLTRAAMLQTYRSIEANTREVADLLKRRPNA
jgi:hypothetical protein